MLQDEVVSNRDGIPIVYDQIIIGGGFSGISAAKALSDKGQTNFCVLENNDYLGGRNYSYQAKDAEGNIVPGVRHEHGSQFVGKLQQPLWGIVISKEFNDWMGKHHPAETKVDHNQTHNTENPTPTLPGILVDNYHLRAGKDLKQNLWDCMVLDATKKGEKKWFPFNRIDTPFADIGVTGLATHLGLANFIALGLKIVQIQFLEQSINILDPKASPDFLKKTAAQWDNTTWETFLSDWWCPPTAASVLNATPQALLSVESHQLSVFYFLFYTACNGGFLNELNDSEFGPQQFWLRCGFGRVLEFLADNNNFADKITMKRRVTDVTVTDGIATVTHQTEDDPSTKVSFKAKKVIVAVAAHTCLKINFGDAINKKWAPLFNNAMGKTYKCQIFYPQQWWNKVPADVSKPVGPENKRRGWQGYTTADDCPVMWSMDTSVNNADGNFVPCLMTFTIGDFCDELHAKVAACDDDEQKIQKVLRDWLLPHISFLYTGTYNYAPALHCTHIVGFNWDTKQLTNFIGGGPNTIMAPGFLTGAAGALLDQNYEDTIYFGCAETSRNFNPKNPVQFDPSIPYDPKKDGPCNAVQYSDTRLDLGYMNGGIHVGQFMANSAMGATPTPPAPTPKPTPKRIAMLQAYELAMLSMEAVGELPNVEAAIVQFIETIKKILGELGESLADILKDLSKGKSFFLKSMGEIGMKLLQNIPPELIQELGTVLGDIMRILVDPVIEKLIHKALLAAFPKHAKSINLIFVEDGITA